MITIRIPNSIYRIPVHVFIGDWETYYDYIKNTYGTSIINDEDKADGATIPVKDEDGCNIITIWLRNFNTRKPLDLSVLNHESIHATMMIFNRLGAKVSTNNDEHLAYMSQYIFEQVLITIEKNKGIKKNGNSKSKSN